MEKVPCRYFEQSKLTKPKPTCPFGADCFYKHLNDDGTPHVFKDGVDRSMKKFRRRGRRGFTRYLGRSNVAIMDGLNAAIDELSQRLMGIPWEPIELNDSHGVEEDFESESGGEEAVVSGSEPREDLWMTGFRDLVYIERLSEFEPETPATTTATSTTTTATATTTMATATTTTTATTTVAGTWTCEDTAGPSSGESEAVEPPFVTDGRGRVVGSSCITI